MRKAQLENKAEQLETSFSCNSQVFVQGSVISFHSLIFSIESNNYCVSSYVPILNLKH